MSFENEFLSGIAINYLYEIMNDKEKLRKMFSDLDKVKESLKKKIEEKEKENEKNNSKLYNNNVE